MDKTMVLTAHKKLCDEMAGHSVLLAVMKPSSTSQRAEFTIALNDKIALRHFINTLIMYYEQSEAPEGEVVKH